jgi:hypothetical protein
MSLAWVFLASSLETLAKDENIWHYYLAEKPLYFYIVGEFSERKFNIQVLPM